MSDLVNRQWLLAQRPKGVPSSDDFRWHEGTVARPQEGEVLVKNLYLACEPTQLGWAAGETYLPAVGLGEVMRSLGAGEILESRDPAFKVGQRVQGLLGWQDFATVSASGHYPMLPLLSDAPLEASLSILGNTGMTAYFGMLDIGKPKPGETVVVSAAAGATGSVAGQIAKIQGCRVVGIAGGEDKCRYLVEQLGFDAAIDYKRENLLSRLRQTCPQGIDIYFDNVGGKTLDAAFLYLALRGRVVLCGAISGYADPGAMTGPRNYLRLLRQRGRMEGFIVLDYLHRAEEAMLALRDWHERGLLKDRVDVLSGLEQAPVALRRLFTGENQGKQLVRL
ncbi:MAG: NADP-dependent oxidoreductase [Myxococcales bacterium]